MKTIFCKRSIITAGLTLVFFLASVPLRAQDLNFDDFLKASSEDAHALIGSYLSPAMLGFGYGLNGGWYNTAKPHKRFGVDLTFTVNAAVIPDDDEFFEFVVGAYNNVVTASGRNEQLPTLMGPAQSGPDLIASYTNNEGQLITQTITPPKGLGLGNFNAVPLPMVSLGVGLLKGTDLKVRYMPEVNTKDFNSRLVGFGVMHDIKQWIPAVKRLPLDLSVLAAFTDASITYSLDDIGIDGSDQVAEFDVNAWNVQLLVSKKLAFLTLYGGVGYAGSKVKLGIKGIYRFDADETDPTSGTVTLTDPVQLDTNGSGARATVGLRLKLAVLTLHGDYTAQKYNTLGVGIGLSFR